jgi:hypothetical protein
MSNNSVTFCFLVTKDLVKEHIWRKWLERLAELKFKFKVVTHCSPAHIKHINSDWLRESLLPADYLFDTAWGWVMNAMLAMYTYATEQAPADWYSLHSETCVPFVSPEKFIESYRKFKQNTFISHCKAWWSPSPKCGEDRANLHLLPSEYHLAHAHWVILCHEDLTQLVKLAKDDEHLTRILIGGSSAEESFVAIFLYKINNFKNVINKLTTITDWKRTPNGKNPYIFNSWNEADRTAIAEICADQSKHEYMFMRKLGADFPDEILCKMLCI